MTPFSIGVWLVSGKTVFVLFPTFSTGSKAKKEKEKIFEKEEVIFLLR